MLCCVCHSGAKRLGQPGTPGSHDLEAALRSLSARQQNHSSERPFFDVERERKLHALASKCDEAECSSGFLTPDDSLVSSPAPSTGTNYSNGSPRHSCDSSGGSRSYLPDRLQIVKPLEGKSIHFVMQQHGFWELSLYTDIIMEHHVGHHCHLPFSLRTRGFCIFSPSLCGFSLGALAPS